MTSSLAITMLVDDKKSGGKEFFFHILECSVLNAYVLHNFVHSKSSIDYLEFRLDLVESPYWYLQGSPASWSPEECGAVGTRAS